MASKSNATISDDESEEEKEGEKDKEDGEEKKEDEYEYDSSDEEDIRNTIGNIPVNWYDEHEHIGYNLDGKQVRISQN